MQVTPNGTGIGEIGTCGVPAAISNAIFHATGKRLRNLPITLENLMKPFDDESDRVTRFPLPHRHDLHHLPARPTPDCLSRARR